MKRWERTLVLVAALILVTAASCGPKSSGLTPMQQTLTPMNEQVMQTITARAGKPSSDDKLANAIQTATVEANMVYGTETAVAALNEPARLATATAIAPVIAELPRYGIDPSQGFVAWLHPPAVIELHNSLEQIGTANDFQNITAVDMVMAADITWHTEASTSGCGFMFRSNGDKNKPSQYMLVISRVAGGQAAFLGMVDGKLSNFHSYYPKNQDKSFNWYNDTTNRLAIVVHGQYVDVYTNGVFITKVDVTQPPDTSIRLPPMPDQLPGASPSQQADYTNAMNTQDQAMQYLNGQLAQAMKNFTTAPKILGDGFNGFIAINQSGYMKCTFSNAWMFTLVK